MKIMDYHFSGEEEQDSPSLVYYQNILEENLDKAIGMAGSAQRLWPHIKTHKTSSLLKMQMDRGISRFKCATIAEAELAAMAGAAQVLVAYPLVGTAIGRFAKLMDKYEGTTFWAMGDNLEQLALLGKAVIAHNKAPVNTLIDVNLGMNRTGVLPDKLEDFFKTSAGIEGLCIKGFHCYDGHLKNKDVNERTAAAKSASESFWQIKVSLEKQGYEIPVLIMGGTPTFPCHKDTQNIFLSPGTLFIQDHGYNINLPDLQFNPGAAIMTRVISHPDKNLFTVDTGVKAIASDPVDRGIIADFPEAKSVLHSEEHWVWKLENCSPPPVGSILYIIPTHICPTSALYSGILIVRDGKLVDYWEVGARNRKITI